MYINVTFDVNIYSLAGLLEHIIGCNELQSAISSQSAEVGKDAVVFMYITM